MIDSSSVKVVRLTKPMTERIGFLNVWLTSVKKARKYYGGYFWENILKSAVLESKTKLGALLQNSVEIFRRTKTISNKISSCRILRNCLHSNNLQIDKYLFSTD